MPHSRPSLGAREAKREHAGHAHVKTAHYASVVALLALIALGLAWELWLAPLRPGGSWLLLKVLPLLAALRGVLHGRRYTFQWLSLLTLVYLAEGLTRGWSDVGLGQRLAWLEALLAAILFAASVVYSRLAAPSRRS